MTIEITQNEAEVLLKMIDLAVRSQGMGAAEAGVILTKKINDVFRKDIEENGEAGEDKE